MTHEKEIVRWSKLPDNTSVWWKDKLRDWTLTTRAMWCSEDKYIVNDEFAKTRRAFVDGKLIQQKILWSDDCPKSFTRGWHDYNTDDSNNINGSHNGTKAIYRIRPEPMFKSGDWIKNRNFTEPFQADEAWIEKRSGGNTNKTDWNEDFSLWEPKVGEWIIYPVWMGMSEKNQYTVREYKTDMRDHVGITPLEFIKQLKAENNA